MICQKRWTKIRPVDLAGVVERRRYALDARDEQHHIVADASPDVHDRHGQDGRILGRGPPGRMRHAHGDQGLIDRTCLWAVEELPDDGDRHDRGHVGKEDDRSEQSRAADVPRQEDREKEGQEDRRGDGKAGVDEGGQERADKARVALEPREIPQAHEDWRVRPVPLERAQDDAGHDGKKHEGQEAREVGRKEGQGYEAIPSISLGRARSHIGLPGLCVPPGYLFWSTMSWRRRDISETVLSRSWFWVKRSSSCLLTIVE